MNDATFEDGADQPLHIKALETDDLTAISALAQDAVFPASEMTWRTNERRFAVLLNRFRWEDSRGATQAPERVQALLVVDGVMKVASQGVVRGDKDLILSVLSITFEPGEDGAGQVILTLAGDGAISAHVEALDVTLKDVTKPYVAVSKQTPKHPG